MQVPSIRKSEGIFEIFVPGIFLSIHLLIALIINFKEIFTIVLAELKELEITSLTFITFLICFGYLLGMILRLLKASSTDYFSHLFFRLQFWRKKQLWMTDTFPYFDVLKERIEKNLPKEAIQFFNDIWDSMNQDKEIEKIENKRFFNYCKNIIHKKDITLLEEIFAIEVTVRYLSGMFFSLVFSIIALVSIILFSEEGHLINFIITLSLIYLFIILIILDKFRRIRIKEVELVFDATFQNKNLFQK